MVEIDHIKLINDRINNIEKTLSKESSFEFSSIIKNTISYQIEKLNKAKQLANKKIQNTKQTIKKLYNTQKKKIQQLLSSSLNSISNNKCIKEFLNSIKTIFSGSKKVLKMMKDKFVNLLKGVFDILSSIKSFIFDKIQIAFTMINKLLYGIPGKTWTMAKYLFKTVYKVFGWALKIGKVALEFIWSGVKTIFNISVTAISTSINYLGKGTKVFFTWWFKMLIKTMFNPSMWIINIPLFAAISIVAFSALGIVLATSASVILPVFEISFDLLTTIGGWLYDGISWVFNWLSHKYEDSFLQKNIINPFIDFLSDNIPQKLKDMYGTVTSWGESAYKWIMKNGKGTINYIKGIVKDINSAYKEFPGQTAFQKFLNFLVNKEFTWKIPGLDREIVIPLLPGPMKRYLTTKFGFILSYQGTPQSLYSGTKFATEQTEKQLVISTIELEYTKLFKQGIKEGKGYLTSDIIYEKLSKNIIPQLSSTVAKTISSRSFKDAIEDGIANAQTSFLDDKGIINPAVVDSLAYTLSKLRRNIKLMESGEYDATNPTIVKDMVYTINGTVEQVESMRRRVNVLKNTERSGNDVISLVEEYNKKLDKTSILPTQKDIQKREQLLENRNIFTKTIYDPIRMLFGNKESTLRESESVEFNNMLNRSSDVIKKAHGDIIIPNKSEMNKTIALDNRGVEFIRSKIKDILPPKLENTTKNDEAPNITIIEEHNNYTDSYEIYTMNQLSQGILRN